MNRSYFWVLPLGILWSVIQLVIFVARFGRLHATVLGESLYFAPVGIVSGIVLVYLLQRADNRTTRISTTVGYLVASPFALIGSLASGLLFHPLLGVTLFGSIPLVLGTAVGYYLGRRVTM